MDKISIENFHPNTSILLEEDFLNELRDKATSEEKSAPKQNFKEFTQWFFTTTRKEQYS